MGINSKAVFGGSFDPMHEGHINIIKRARKAYKFLTVVVYSKLGKVYKKSFSERLDFVARKLQNMDVKVIGLEKGLLVNLAKQLGANILIRGYRTKQQLNKELKMAEINESIVPEVGTHFYKLKRKYSKLSYK